MPARRRAERAPEPHNKIQVALRMDPDLKAAVEQLAHERGIPYQTMIQTWVAERLREEIQPSSRQELASLSRQVRRLLSQLERKLKPVPKP